MKPPAPLRGVRAAVVSLTRLPLGGFPYSDADWRWSTAYFPLVGALVGLATAGVLRLFERAGSLAAAALALSVGALLTGAMHEDGLADTADALGGASSRERLFAILKDSRVGSYGALTLVLSVVLKLALLEHLGGRAAGALVLAHCAARSPAVWLLWALPYVTASELAKSAPFARPGGAQVLLASLWPVALSLVGLARGEWRLSSLIVLASVLGALTLLCAQRFLTRAGGVTGDFLGATEQLSEIATLLVLSMT